MGARYYAIVNRAAAGGRCARLAPDALAALEARGVALDIAFTEKPRHATELARAAAANGRRHFLSAGGDGTAAEIVNGLVEAGVSEECELAMLPLGTGNSFLRDFGITDTKSAVDAIEAGFEVGTRTIVDVLIAQQRYFQAQRDNSLARHTYIVDHLRLKASAGVLAEEDLQKVNSILK